MGCHLITWYLKSYRCIALCLYLNAKPVKLYRIFWNTPSNLSVRLRGDNVFLALLWDVFVCNCQEKVMDCPLTDLSQYFSMLDDFQLFWRQFITSSRHSNNYTQSTSHKRDIKHCLVSISPIKIWYEILGRFIFMNSFKNTCHWNHALLFIIHSRRLFFH